MYLTENGDKCAGGVCLAYYDSRFECEDVNTLVHNFGKEIFGQHQNNLSLISAMQEVHDNRDVEEWEQGYRYIASIYDLVVPILNRCDNGDVEAAPVIQD